MKKAGILLSGLAFAVVSAFLPAQPQAHADNLKVIVNSNTKIGHFKGSHHSKVAHHPKKKNAHHCKVVHHPKKKNNHHCKVVHHPKKNNHHSKVAHHSHPIIKNFSPKHCKNWKHCKHTKHCKHWGRKYHNHHKHLHKLDVTLKVTL